ncbi:MAG: hypothetical protein J3R72DRAFT_454866 [Linnemannia gamsii]|nr:MAG: hypothetical protein J3R72DRAFT_454866 [Linnemannia gamsii]
MRRFTPAAFIPAFIAILAAHSTTVNAQSDPVMDYCSNVGCSTVVSLLNPCGGGASNSSLQQDLTFTVTPDLGSCECNSRFFNALSECLGCISSQNKNHPVIDTQINWTNNCKAYGFNMTDAPIPYTPPTSSGSSQGLGAGAIAGIVVGVLVLIGAGGFFFLKNWRRRSKNSIFERPYTAANASGSYEPTNNQAGFNTYSNYQHDEYPDNNQNQQGGYSDYDQNNYYGSGQNGDDSMAMSNLQHSNYIPPPIPMSPSAVAAVASTTGIGSIQRPLGEPRPSDQFPQSLRVGASKEWDDNNRQNEYTSDLVSNDHLLHNDKAVIEDDNDELEPPRARDRYRNDRDDFTQRRSMTPPRANMQSYRDEFTRPSFDREPRRNSGSERGSVSGLRVAAGGSGYNSQDEGSEGRLDMGESPESARRRRAAELFSAEGSRR